MDGVQCGHFRTGRFQSFQRILEGTAGGFVPDGIAMAKSLGGGFPMGAFWVRDKYGDLLGPGTHGTTFGGTPLACAVASRILEVIQREDLAENARHTGEWMRGALESLVRAYPGVLRGVRGLGFIIGLELAEKEQIRAFAGSEQTASLQLVNRLHKAGLLTIPSGAQIVRLLPPLNLTRAEAEEGVGLIEKVVKGLR